MNFSGQRPRSQAVVERVQALDPGTQRLLLFILCTAVPGVVTAELVRWKPPRAHQPGELRRCQRPSCGGSGPLSVMASVGEQDALAQQVWFRSPVHLPFDHFDAVDVAFDGAGAVGQGEARVDRRPVFAQSGGKGP